MTAEEALKRNVQLLIRGAEEALESADAERKAGRNRFAMNRIYYACFYAASAVLLVDGRHFVKHKGVRTAVHRDLVHPGHLAASWGDFYDEIFEARHKADYAMFVDFDDRTVADRSERGRGFVGEMKRLLEARGYVTQG